MILTRDIIDIICPNHGRTSCNDSDPNNGYYEIKETKFRGIVIEKNFKTAPRCHRCFLLDAEGYDTDLMDITVIPTIELVIKQPKVKVTIEEEK
jgi:hypothetical protein